MTAQALPDQYPSLAQLYQMAPLMAFAQAGDQQRIADENNPRFQAAFDQNMQQDQVMNPLKAVEMASQNDHRAAQVKLLNQQAEAARLANAYTGGTQPGAITAANAKAGRDTDVSMADQMEAQGRVYGQLASRLQDPALTPWERVGLVKEAMGDHAQRYPGLDKMLMDNHGNLADKFDTLSKSSYDKSKEARKAEADEKKRLAMIDAQGENARELAQMKIDAAMESMKLKTTAKKEQSETTDKHKARLVAILTNPNSTADEKQEAAAAMTIYQQYDVTKAQAGQMVGDSRMSALIPSLSGRTLSTPPIVPPATIPSAVPVRAPMAVPSGPGVDGRPRVPPQGAESIQIIRAEYDKETNPASKAALARELARLGVNVGAPAPAAGDWDAAKEARFQAWKAKQGK